ncbi:MAG: cytochrome BD ubiquinol oxidase subunit II, partial [Pseudomonadota bacterium]
KGGLIGVIAGLIAVSLASPLVSPRIFEKWFGVPEFLLLAPLPIISAGLIVFLWIALRHLPDRRDQWCWVPFIATTALFALAFAGLAYTALAYTVFRGKATELRYD